MNISESKTLIKMIKLADQGLYEAYYVKQGLTYKTCVSADSFSDAVTRLMNEDVIDDASEFTTCYQWPA